MSGKKQPMKKLHSGCLSHAINIVSKVRSYRSSTRLSNQPTNQPTNQQTNKQTSWCIVLLQKLTIAQLVKFPTFDGTRSFINHVHKSPSLVPILSQMHPSKISNPISLRPIVILSSYLFL